MELVLIIGLIVLGIIFLVIEVFLIPGISIAGIASLLCYIAGISMAYVQLGPETGTWFLGISAVVSGLVMYWFFRSKSLDKMSLKSSIDSNTAPLKGLEAKPGDVGVTLSRLAPIGNILLNGVIVEGRCENEIIEPNVQIVVVEIGSTNVLVRKSDH